MQEETAVEIRDIRDPVTTTVDITIMDITVMDRTILITVDHTEITVDLGLTLMVVLILVQAVRVQADLEDVSLDAITLRYLSSFAWSKLTCFFYSISAYDSSCTLQWWYKVSRFLFLLRNDVIANVSICLDLIAPSNPGATTWRICASSSTKKQQNHF